MWSALKLAPIVLLSGTAKVPPGAVVRWPGTAVESCVLGDRSFRPLAGSCYYPIDLLTPEGKLVVGRMSAGRSEQASIEIGPYPYPEQHVKVEDRMVQLSAEDLERSKRETARVEALWELGGERRFELPLRSPLARLPTGGRFGTRRFFNGQPRSPHSGVDYKAATGTAVFATGDGIVALAEAHFFSGKSVFIDHGDDLVSMYFHLSRIDVKPGQRVRKGERLGAVGATGRASGPHLHFGLRWHGARIDPGPLLRAPERLPTIDAGAGGAP